jgi:nucleoside-diphosphate-sugar epimerase
MTLQGRRALVTGGTGFLGAHLVRRLVDEGADVHVVSRRSHSGSALPLPASARLHLVDLESADALRAVVRDVGAASVFHLAGRVDLGRSLEVAQACVRENIDATLNLLHALDGTPVERLVYTSTTEVYGRNATPFYEEQPVDPPSAYAVSKLAGERLCRIHAELQGFGLTILRLATGYGPGQRPERLVPSTILSCLRGTPIRLHSAGHRRDFIYVDDLVEGVVRAASRTTAGPVELMNLGSEAAISVAQVAECIMRVSGKVRPVLDAESERPNEAPCWRTNADRARQLLGWTPQTSLEDGLTRTYRYYAATEMAATS